VTLTSLPYNASDNNSAISQGTNSVQYTKAADGTVLIEKDYLSGTLTGVYRNAGGVMQTCNLTNQSNYAILDNYVALPGGVMLTIENSAPIYSLTNFHGDTEITVGATGNPTTGVFLYDPFGQIVTSNTFGTGPSNLNNASNSSMGCAASPMRKSTTMFSIPIMQMGARTYLPTLGRFTSVDPIAGGNDNAYSYTNDPINESDYNGDSLWSSIVSAAKAVVHFVTNHPVATAVVIAVVIAVVVVAILTRNPAATARVSAAGASVVQKATVAASRAAPIANDVLSGGTSKPGPNASLSEAAAPIGSRGATLEQDGVSFEPNAPATIGSRLFTGHALDAMQNRGIYPSIVENTIAWGREVSSSTEGTIRYYDPINNLSVVVDSQSGRVVTTFFGD
jgi:RHS repeat-associated protein